MSEAQRQRLWGKNPIALLAALWVAFMVFWAICDDVQAQPAVERSQRHSQRLAYFLSGAKSRPYNRSEIVGNTQTGPASILAGLAAENLAGDTRLSESVSPGRFRQSNPVTAVLSDGSIVVAFEDERQGSKKIFLQKYTSSGAPLGANVLGAGRADGYDLVEPAIVATVSDKFYLGYRDVAAGQVKVARFNGDLSVDLAGFVASDNAPFVYAGPFALSARANGEFAVAYESYATGNTIALRRFDATGTLVSATDAVNSDGASVSHWVPDLAFDETGGLGVVWEDYRTGVADIFFRHYDSLGNAQGSEINLIDADARAQGQFLPSLVFSGIHGFVTGWSDTRFGWTVYLQRYSKQPGVGLIGANSPVTPLDSLTKYLDVDLAVSATGLVSAVYCSYGATSDALAQRFDASLAPFGSVVTLASEPVDQPVSPALAIGTRQALVWVIRRNGDRDIQLTVADSNLSPLNATPILVNDDASGAVSDQPEVAVVNGASIITAFRDLRRDGGDIFVQASAIDGGLIGANRLVNQDNPGGVQSEPSIAANAQSYVVAWNDQRFISGVNPARIYVRYGVSGGALTSAEILVSGDNPFTGIAPKATPKVALAPNGSAMIVWLDSRTGVPEVFARLLDSNRTPVGNEFQVSDASVGVANTKPIVSVDDNNVFTVVWEDVAAPGGVVINVRRYNPNRILLGNFAFTSDQPGSSISDFDIDVDNSGQVYLLWKGTDSAGQVTLYLTVLSNTGTQISSTAEIPDNLSASPAEPTISVDEFGNVLMAWIDSRGPERRVYTQNFTAALTPAGGNQPLSLAGAPAMFSPGALAVRGRSWVGWADARSEGMNIYLRGFVHFPTDVTDDEDALLPDRFALKQNYPNPFNPSTQIAFTLPQRAELTLTIYNILGQEIRTLAQGVYPAGEHQVLWDGTDYSGSPVASGVYFYRLKSAAFTQTRKLTLLK